MHDYGLEMEPSTDGHFKATLKPKKDFLGRPFKTNACMAFKSNDYKELFSYFLMFF